MASQQQHLLVIGALPRSLASSWHPVAAAGLTGRSFDAESAGADQILFRRILGSIDRKPEERDQNRSISSSSRASQRQQSDSKQQSAKTRRRIRRWKRTSLASELENNNTRGIEPTAYRGGAELEASANLSTISYSNGRQSESLLGDRGSQSQRPTSGASPATSLQNHQTNQVALRKSHRREPVRAGDQPVLVSEPTSVSESSPLELLFMFVLATFGCMGTIFLISGITVIESLQTRGNCYMVSLSLSQLLVNLLVIPSSALKIVAGDAINSRQLCHYQWLLFEFSLMVGQLSFLCMAVDNYLGYKCSKRLRIQFDDKVAAVASKATTAAPDHLELANEGHRQLQRQQQHQPDDKVSSSTATMSTSTSGALVSNKASKLQLARPPSEPLQAAPARGESSLVVVGQPPMNHQRQISSPVVVSNRNSNNNKSEYHNATVWQASAGKQAQPSSKLASRPQSPSDARQIDQSLAPRVTCSKPLYVASYGAWCGSFKVPVWATLIWLLAICYILQAHQVAHKFGVPFCSASSNSASGLARPTSVVGLPDATKLMSKLATVSRPSAQAQALALARQATPAGKLEVPSSTGQQLRRTTRQLAATTWSPFEDDDDDDAGQSYSRPSMQVAAKDEAKAVGHSRVGSVFAPALTLEELISPPRTPAKADDNNDEFSQAGRLHLSSNSLPKFNEPPSLPGRPVSHKSSLEFEQDAGPSNAAKQEALGALAYVELGNSDLAKLKAAKRAAGSAFVSSGLEVLEIESKLNSELLLMLHQQPHRRDRKLAGKTGHYATNLARKQADHLADGRLNLIIDQVRPSASRGARKAGHADTGRVIDRLASGLWRTGKLEVARSAAASVNQQSNRLGPSPSGSINNNNNNNMKAKRAQASGQRALGQVDATGKLAGAQLEPASLPDFGGQPAQGRRSKSDYANYATSTADLAGQPGAKAQRFELGPRPSEESGARDSCHRNSPASPIERPTTYHGLPAAQRAAFSAGANSNNNDNDTLVALAGQPEYTGETARIINGSCNETIPTDTIDRMRPPAGPRSRPSGFGEPLGAPPALEAAKIERDSPIKSASPISSLDGRLESPISLGSMLLVLSKRDNNTRATEWAKLPLGFAWEASRPILDQKAALASSQLEQLDSPPIGGRVGGRSAANHAAPDQAASRGNPTRAARSSGEEPAHQAANLLADRAPSPFTDHRGGPTQAADTHLASFDRLYYFWLVLLGSVVVPSLATSLLFLRAYLTMRQFKTRPYCTLPVDSAASLSPNALREILQRATKEIPALVATSSEAGIVVVRPPHSSIWSGQVATKTKPKASCEQANERPPSSQSSKFDMPAPSSRVELASVVESEPLAPLITAHCATVDGLDRRRCRQQVSSSCNTIGDGMATHLTARPSSELQLASTYSSSRCEQQLQQQDAIDFSPDSGKLARAPANSRIDLLWPSSSQPMIDKPSRRPSNQQYNDQQQQQHQQQFLDSHRSSYMANISHITSSKTSGGHYGVARSAGLWARRLPPIMPIQLQTIGGSVSTQRNVSFSAPPSARLVALSGGCLRAPSAFGTLSPDQVEPPLVAARSRTRCSSDDPYSHRLFSDHQQQIIMRQERPSVASSRSAASAACAPSGAHVFSRQQHHAHSFHLGSSSSAAGSASVVSAATGLATASPAGLGWERRPQLEWLQQAARMSRLQAANLLPAIQAQTPDELDGCAEDDSDSSGRQRHLSSSLSSSLSLARQSSLPRVQRNIKQPSTIAEPTPTTTAMGANLHQASWLSNQEPLASQHQDQPSQHLVATVGDSRITAALASVIRSSMEDHNESLGLPSQATAISCLGAASAQQPPNTAIESHWKPKHEHLSQVPASEDEPDEDDGDDDQDDSEDDDEQASVSSCHEQQQHQAGQFSSGRSSGCQARRQLASEGPPPLPTKTTICTYSNMTDDQLLKSNIIVFVFNLILWMPFIGLSIAVSNDRRVTQEIRDIVWWITTLNCCSCPYIYAMTNKDFREAFNKLFYYCCCKSHVTFQRKTPIFRRQLDMDSGGNLRIHIIPGLNLYASKQATPIAAPMLAPAMPAIESRPESSIQNNNNDSNGGYNSPSTGTTVDSVGCLSPICSTKVATNSAAAGLSNSVMPNSMPNPSSRPSDRPGASSGTLGGGAAASGSGCRRDSGSQSRHYGSPASRHHQQRQSVSHEANNNNNNNLARVHQMSRGGGASFGGPSFASTRRLSSMAAHDGSKRRALGFGRSSERCKRSAREVIFNRNQRRSVNEL